MTRESAISYHGAYINLDRSPDRRDRMEAQLAAFGLEHIYIRHAAVDGSALKRPHGALRPGETGAFLSHAGALEALHSHGTPVHILEDDALLSGHVAQIIEEAIAAGLFEHFDILFTDTFVSPHLGMLKGLKNEFDQFDMRATTPLRLSDLQVIDLKGQNFSCLTSYVVGAKSIERILALYRAETQKGPTKPVDIFIRDCVLAGKLRAAFLFPFVTSFRLEEVAGSTIAGEGTVPTPSVMVLAVLRYLFFVGRDVSKAKALLDSATRENRRPVNPHHTMIVQALEFILSADFQEF